MQTFFKSLLISSILLIPTQKNHAENTPHFNNQIPFWNFGQTPIAWGDCIPVPVAPISFQQNNMGMNQAPIPQPMMLPFSFPMPTNELPFVLPPPSPFFNASTVTPIPVPVMPNVAQAACDDSTLKALQVKYNQGALASKNKITEITQALNDSNNQMADARVIIDQLTKQSAESKSKLSSDISMLEMQLTNTRNTNKSLQAKLSTAETSANNQTRKINELGQSTTELTALKSAYKERSDESSELKKQLVDSDNANKSLQTKLSTAESDASHQTRKITVLNQSATELVALQNAYKTRTDENTELKRQLVRIEDNNKSLQSQLITATTNAGAQARKLNALGQTAPELAALKSAYKDRNAESASLKIKLGKLDDAYIKLQAQLTKAQSDASTQNRKLTILDQSAKELSATQSAYKDKLNQNVALKAQLTELKALQTFSKSCRAEVSGLGMKLTNIDTKRKSLLEKMTALENTSSDQAKEINVLKPVASELKALKGAYKDLSSKHVELNDKLTKATADTDKDGILDSADKCPSSPMNSHVNEKGCPKIIDADGDTVADASDLCPATPTGTAVNEFGCEPTKNITLDGVNFATGSARLTPDSIPILTVAAEKLNKNLALNVEISGYTDNQGVGSINKRLSQRRANSVMIQLIKDNVDANRLTAKGYGEENPIASNNTANGRATNRRVELKIRK